MAGTEVGPTRRSSREKKGQLEGLALHEPNTFSVMARTLVDLNMLSSPMGATAFSATIDGCAWGLLAMAITLARGVGGQSQMVMMLCTVTSGMAFFAVCLMVELPAAAWVAKRTPEGEEVDDLHACALLVGVMVAAFMGDLIGIHVISGAFVYGLVIPNGPLGAVLERGLGSIDRSPLVSVVWFGGVREDGRD